jgi:hypothetical protein
MANKINSGNDRDTYSIEKSAKKILMKLQKKGVILRQTSSSNLKSDIYYEFAATEPGRAQSGKKVSADLVKELLVRDWIESSSDGYKISKSGVAWLRRVLSSNDEFRLQHQTHCKVFKTDADGKLESYIVNECESPLGWLRRRKNRQGKPLISDEQFMAGERIRADFWRAQMTPRVTQDWSQAPLYGRRRRSANDGSPGLTDSALAAKKRVMKALEAIGPELAGVIIDVCCHLQGIEEAEKMHGWPQRSGKVVLQIALTRLARYYGLIGTSDLIGPITRRIGHWGCENYRPTMG